MPSPKRWAERLRISLGPIQRAGRSWARSWLMILSLAIFCLSLFAGADYLVRRQALEAPGLGHDAFIVLQGYREMERFLDALRGYVFRDSEDGLSREGLLLHFELLASRVSLLTEGEAGKRLSAFPGMRETAQELSDALLRIEPLLARLRPDPRSADYRLIRWELLRDQDRLFALAREFLVRGESPGTSLMGDAVGYGGYGYLAAVMLSGGLLFAVYASELRRARRSTAALAEESDQLREARAELFYQATHDALTGLINRAEFERRLQRVLVSAQLRGTEGALLYLDMDRFKLVNDSCGHFAGDQLLRQVGTLLGGRVRKRDTLARLGGDEFAVLLEHCSLPEALQVAEDIREVIRSFRFMWEHRTFEVGLSIGIAAISPASDSPEAVLMAADEACYAAKHAGRNCIHIYTADPAAAGRAGARIEWAARIEHSLEANRLHLYRQAILPLVSRGGQGEFFEIFVRMEDEEGGLMAPEAFLPAAERYQLVGDLDRWVIGETLTWLAACPRRLDAVGLCFINLSGHSLDDDRMRDFVTACLQQHGVPPQKICFDVAEVAAVANLGKTIEFMEPLRALGVRFALDNFGSGASSFAYLKHLPVEFIKIDGGLVRDSAQSLMDRALVRAIRDVAAVMGKDTIAECVEDAASLEALRDIGVDFVQGYAINRPHPLGDPQASPRGATAAS